MCPLISTSLPMSSALRARARSLGFLMGYMIYYGWQYCETHKWRQNAATTHVRMAATVAPSAIGVTGTDRSVRKHASALPATADSTVRSVRTERVSDPTLILSVTENQLRLRRQQRQVRGFINARVVAKTVWSINNAYHIWALFASIMRLFHKDSLYRYIKWSLPLPF